MKKILPVIIMTLLLSSCGGNIVAKVGNIKISSDEFNFYLDSIKTQMHGTELKTDEDWENREIEGKKAIDIAKEKAMDIAVKNALYIEAPKAAGVKLSAEDRRNIGVMKSRLMEGYGGSAAYTRYLKDNNINDKFINMMVESSAYQSKVREYLQETSPETDEEILEYYEKNKAEIDSRYRKAKHILISSKEQGTGLPLIKSEKDKAQRDARIIYKRARAGEDFDAMMNELSQDPGLADAPDGYVYTSGDMVAEFEDCVDSLEFNDIGFCESEHGFHVVKRLPLTYEDMKEDLTIEVQTNKLEEIMGKWAEEFGVEVVKYEDSYKEIK